MEVLFRAEVKNRGKVAESRIKNLIKIDGKFYCIGFESLLDGQYVIIDKDGNDCFECKYDTRAIHFEDMIDLDKNKLFASLSEDGKGGDIFLFDNEVFIIWLDSQSLKINATNKDNFDCNCHDSLQEWYVFENKCYDLKAIGIQK